MEEKNQSKQSTDKPEEEKAEAQSKPEAKDDRAPKEDKKTQNSSAPVKEDSAASPKGKQADEEPVQVPEKFKKLVEQIENLSVLDLAELVKILEKKFGVSAAMPVAAVAGGAGQAAGSAEPEKTSFNVELTSAGEQKINVIKVVREVSGLGLKEAKDLVDGAPKIVKEGVKKEEAEELKKKLEAAGASVELK